MELEAVAEGAHEEAFVAAVHAIFAVGDEEAAHAVHGDPDTPQGRAVGGPRVGSGRPTLAALGGRPNPPAAPGEIAAKRLIC